MAGTAHSIASALIALFAVSGAGCASAHAKSLPMIPPLDMPTPPPREIRTADMDQPPPAELIEEPARHAAPNTLRRSAAPPKPDASRDDPPPKPEPTTPPPEPVRPVEEARPPTTLQMPRAGSEGEAEGKIHTLLARATADLNRVNRRSLSVDARTQYELAQSFVRQANDAVRQKNLVFAMSLAEKAAVLAAQLAGR